MITVSELTRWLNEYDDDTPVYWGVDEFPCWIAKEDATLKDFPVRYGTFTHKDYGEIGFLYFGDYTDYEKEHDKVAKLSWQLDRIPHWVQWIFNRSIKKYL